MLEKPKSLEHLDLEIKFLKQASLKKTSVCGAENVLRCTLVFKKKFFLVSKRYEYSQSGGVISQNF